MKKIVFSFTILMFAIQQNYAQNFKLLVGTYTNKGNSEGIYYYDFNSRNGDLKQIAIIKNIINPSYLTVSNNLIYSVTENGLNSSVSAYQADWNNHSFKLLNKETVQGADPCYIIADKKHVITANYSSGNINVFGLKPDGSLDVLKQNIQHLGKGPDKRQKNAHAHQTVFSPDQQYVLVTDLGEDKIYTYKYQPNSALPLAFQSVISTNAGTGPRHLTFSPNGKFVYLIHEFNGMISVYSYHDGNLSFVQEIETVTPNFKGAVDGADIHISKDSKFLYSSNRGDANTINVFSVLKNGKLEMIQSISTLGKGPRNFALDPSEKYLLVAHQHSNDVVIFKRNLKTGKLKDTGKKIEIGAPVCLSFVE